MDQHKNQDPDNNNNDLLIPAQDAQAPTSDFARLTPAQRIHFCRQYLSDRQRGRTDLIWLATQILQYRDVEDLVHGPVAAHLQQFVGREELMDDMSGAIVYSEPACNLHRDNNCIVECPGRLCWYLPGPRFRMLLDPRGHLKTTLNTISHAIQWILNYEDIRIALSVATTGQGSDVITEVENQFRYNEKLRWLYPEYCPPAEKVGEWGSKEQFTILNRRRKWLKEPTMKVVSIGKVVAGPHYEVLKHSDLVDKENVKTASGMKDTKDHYKYCQPLLERGPEVPGRDRTVGWQDLEGTIYDHSDLYCEELGKDEERAKRGQACHWAVFRRDACINPTENDDGTIDWTKPFKTLWPKRFPWTELRAIWEDMGDYLFNCQYRLSPRSRGMGLAQKSEIGIFPAKFKKLLLPRMYVKTTVDLAGMEEDQDGCNNAIVTVGHLPDGRKMVLEALVGRPSPFDIIKYLFELDARYSTGLTQKLIIQIEAAHHAQALIPFINREMELRRRYLTIAAIPRDTSVAKDNRIFYGLQPWFKRRLIWFSDDIPCLPHIIDEITKFPKFKFKDFLDALADQAQSDQSKDGIDHQTDMPRPKDQDPDPMSLSKGNRFLGFDPVTKQPMYSGGGGESESDGPDPNIYGVDTEQHWHENMTGAL